MTKTTHNDQNNLIFILPSVLNNVPNITKAIRFSQANALTLNISTDNLNEISINDIGAALYESRIPSIIFNFTGDSDKVLKYKNIIYRSLFPTESKKTLQERNVLLKNENSKLEEDDTKHKTNKSEMDANRKEINRLEGLESLKRTVILNNIIGLEFSDARDTQIQEWMQKNEHSTRAASCADFPVPVSEQVPFAANMSEIRKQLEVMAEDDNASTDKSLHIDLAGLKTDDVIEIVKELARTHASSLSFANAENINDREWNKIIPELITSLNNNNAVTTISGLYSLPGRWIKQLDEAILSNKNGNNKNRAPTQKPTTENKSLFKSCNTPVNETTHTITNKDEIIKRLHAGNNDPQKDSKIIIDITKLTATDISAICGALATTNIPSISFIGLNSKEINTPSKSNIVDSLKKNKTIIELLGCNGLLDRQVKELNTHIEKNLDAKAQRASQRPDRQPVSYPYKEMTLNVKMMPDIKPMPNDLNGEDNIPDKTATDAIRAQLSACNAQLISNAPTEADKKDVHDKTKILFITKGMDTEIGYCLNNGEYIQEKINDNKLLEIFQWYKAGDTIQDAADIIQINEYLTSKGVDTQLGMIKLGIDATDLTDAQLEYIGRAIGKSNTVKSLYFVENNCEGKENGLINFCHYIQRDNATLTEWTPPKRSAPNPSLEKKLENGFKVLETRIQSTNNKEKYEPALLPIHLNANLARTQPGGKTDRYLETIRVLRTEIGLLNKKIVNKENDIQTLETKAKENNQVIPSRIPVSEFIPDETTDQFINGPLQRLEPDQKHEIIEELGKIKVEINHRIAMQDMEINQLDIINQIPKYKLELQHKTNQITSNTDKINDLKEKNPSVSAHIQQISEIDVIIKPIIGDVVGMQPSEENSNSKEQRANEKKEHDNLRSQIDRIDKLLIGQENVVLFFENQIKIDELNDNRNKIDAEIKQNTLKVTALKGQLNLNTNENTEEAAERIFDETTELADEREKTLENELEKVKAVRSELERELEHKNKRLIDLKNEIEHLEEDLNDELKLINLMHEFDEKNYHIIKNNQEMIAINENIANYLPQTNEMIKLNITDVLNAEVRDNDAPKEIKQQISVLEQQIKIQDNKINTQVLELLNLYRKLNEITPNKQTSLYTYGTDAINGVKKQINKIIKRSNDVLSAVTSWGKSNASNATSKNAVTENTGIGDSNSHLRNVVNPNESDENSDVQKKEQKIFHQDIKFTSPKPTELLNKQSANPTSVSGNINKTETKPAISSTKIIAGSTKGENKDSTQENLNSAAQELLKEVGELRKQNKLSKKRADKLIARTNKLIADPTTHKTFLKKATSFKSIASASLWARMMLVVGYAIKSIPKNDLTDDLNKQSSQIVESARTTLSKLSKISQLATEAAKIAEKTTGTNINQHEKTPAPAATEPFTTAATETSTKTATEAPTTAAPTTTATAAPTTAAPTPVKTKESASGKTDAKLDQTEKKADLPQSKLLLHIEYIEKLTKINYTREAHNETEKQLTTIVVKNPTKKQLDQLNTLLKDYSKNHHGNDDLKIRANICQKQLVDGLRRIEETRAADSAEYRKLFKELKTVIKPQNVQLKEEELTKAKKALDAFNTFASTNTNVIHSKIKLSNNETTDFSKMKKKITEQRDLEKDGSKPTPNR